MKTQLSNEEILPAQHSKEKAKLDHIKYRADLARKHIHDLQMDIDYVTAILEEKEITREGDSLT